MEFEEIKNLIDNSPNIEFGLGVSDDMIRKAEEKLEIMSKESEQKKQNNNTMNIV